MVEAKVTAKASMIPTAGTTVDEKDGFHKRIPVRSYVVVLCEIGGSRVKAVRLDKQKSMEEARQTAVADNPQWRWKGTFPLMDRDFQEGERL